MTRNELTKLWTKITSLFARKTDLTTKADKPYIITVTKLGDNYITDKTHLWEDIEHYIPDREILLEYDGRYFHLSREFDSGGGHISYEFIYWQNNTESLNGSEDSYIEKFIVDDGWDNVTYISSQLNSEDVVYIDRYGGINYLNDGDSVGDNLYYLDNAISDKLDTLLSGTNIKTVNNNSLLGSGNISIAIPGTLNTNNTTAQTVPTSAESLSGTISLHKIAKTGSYNDLLNKPTGMATESYVDGAIANLVNSAPETLDTLEELASALGDDPNFATTVSNLIGNKYTKPSTGIPKSDLSSDVQSVLDSAILSVKTLNTNNTTAQTATSEAINGSGSINLHKIAKTGTYSDLIGKPTIPAAPGTLNTDNTTAQTVSSSEALSGIINLHKVSKTGSYNDLTNKPTIPTVNNATLTIQKNGTNVATFTANASTGATANITVPVATSDLTNDSGFLGDTDVSYDANTKTLIIGSGSVNTYMITFNMEYGFSVRINGGEPIIDQSPISVNEGDSISVVMLVEDRPTATMGGESITVYSSGPEDFYFTIESVTGDIVVSY